MKEFLVVSVILLPHNCKTCKLFNLLYELSLISVIWLKPKLNLLYIALISKIKKGTEIIILNRLNKFSCYLIELGARPITCQIFLIKSWVLCLIIRFFEILNGFYSRFFELLNGFYA